MKKIQKLSAVCEVRLVYNSKTKAAERPHARSANQAYGILKTMWSDQIGVLEEFNILLLDRSSRVIAFSNMAKGGISSTIVDVRLCFATALKARASSLIIAHNHPSGNLTPSKADIALTETFEKVGTILNIKLCDHIILSPEGGYYAFSEHDLI